MALALALQQVIERDERRGTCWERGGLRLCASWAGAAELLVLPQQVRAVSLKEGLFLVRSRIYRKRQGWGVTFISSTSTEKSVLVL